MYNNDSNSLNAGAPDIRLSGNQRMASAPSGNAELYQVYQNALQSGQIPKGTTFEMFKELLQQSQAPQQNSGIMAAAPTGTYTQNRKRQMAAGGGIMGSNNGSMLVAPTADGSRPGYAWYDKFIEPIIKVGQTIIPGGETGYADLYSNPLGTLQTIGETIIPGGEKGYFDLYGGLGKLVNPDEYGKYTIPMAVGAAAGKVQQDYLDKQPEFPIDDTGITFKTAREYMEDPKQRFKPKLEDTQLAASGGRIGYRNGIGPNQGSPGIMSQAATDMEVEDAFGITVDQDRAITDQQVEDAFGISVDDVAPVDKKKLKDLFRRLTEPREMAKYKNLLGKMGEEKIMTPPLGKIGEEKAATPLSDQSKHQNLMMLAEMFEAQGMEFADALKEAQDYFGTEGFGRAEGGRIGYKHGTKKRKGIMQMLSSLEERFPELMMYGSMAAGSVLPFLKEGGRIGAQEGGLMNLGGMEKDYRNEGGFVALGGKEKADDVPARLSKNEFVFTADAVRNAGGGDIDKGAEIMENMMNNLEAGGEVSEDSQGLEGARGMFANAQELEKRII